MMHFLDRGLMKINLFVLLLLVEIGLFSGVADHLKAAPNKGSDHNMRNIDFIYMINLDQRPEKFALSMSYLEKYKINPYRFSAVNGWELSKQDILDV